MGEVPSVLAAGGGGWRRHDSGCLSASSHGPGGGADAAPAWCATCAEAEEEEAPYDMPAFALGTLPKSRSMCAREMRAALQTHLYEAGGGD